MWPRDLTSSHVFYEILKDLHYAALEHELCRCSVHYNVKRLDMFTYVCLVITTTYQRI